MPKGCQLCVKGQKTVLFITGLCKRNCYYCPISDKKKNHDVIYANEWPIKSTSNILKEAKLCSSKGAGITGGDPLLVLNRTVKYIKLLKKEFGKSFHIHLYTPLNLVTQHTLNKLHKAGLDEIRFHPDLNNKKEWKKIQLAKLFDWDIGVEIPVIPNKEKQTKELISYIKDKIDFLNLNELELSDSNANKLLELGFKPKNPISYAVKGSEKLAIKLLNQYKNSNIAIHYCTCTLKDRVQLANRIKQRAKNIAKSYDSITKAGTLIRAAIYLPQLKPSFGYRKKLEQANKKDLLKKLNKIKNTLKIRLDIDKEKLRFLTSINLLKKNLKKIKKLGLIPAIVEEYPTHDQMEIEIEFL